MQNKSKQGELFLITKEKDLSNYIFTITEKTPKKFRFTFVVRMQNLSLDVLENLYRANMIQVKKDSEEQLNRRNQYQREAYVALKLLDYIALSAKEHECILPKQYEQISIQAAEVSSHLIKWTQSDLKRYKRG